MVGAPQKTGFTFRSSTSSFGDFGTGSSNFVKPLDPKPFTFGVKTETNLCEHG